MPPSRLWRRPQSANSARTESVPMPFRHWPPPGSKPPPPPKTGAGAGAGACIGCAACGKVGARPGIADRKSVVYGQSVSVRVDLGGRRILIKNNTDTSRDKRVLSLAHKSKYILRQITQIHTD